MKRHADINEVFLAELRALVDRREHVTAPVTLSVGMPSADTEYQIELPPYTEQFSLKTNDGTAFRVSYQRDRVANSQRPYVTVHAGTRYAETGLNTRASGQVVYVASSTAGKTVEGVAWAKVRD